MKFRIQPIDLMNDVWVIQQRVCWIFWRSVGAGTKAKLQSKLDELNTANGQ
jgi:hypothetical protein